MAHPNANNTASLPETRIIAAPEPIPAVPRLAILKAFSALAFVDVTLRVRGYRHLRRQLVQMTPVTPTSSAEQAQAETLAAVDRAAVFYPRRAMCLQRSAVLTWLLRRRGIQAQLIIGCRHTPFYAHAWVEVDGVIVNDREKVREEYHEMERV